MAVEQGLTSAAARQAAVPTKLLVKPKGGSIPKWTGGPGRSKPKRSKPTPKKKVKATQLELALPFVTAAIEPQQAPDYEQIQQDWDDARTELKRQWPDLADEVIAALALAAGAAAASGSLALLGSLTVNAGLAAPVAAAVAAAMTRLARLAAGQAAAEVAGLGLTVTPDDIDTDRIQALAEAWTGQILAGYATAAGRRGLQLATTTATAAAVAADVRAHLNTISTARTGLVADGIAAAMNTAQGTGRAAVFAQLTGVVWVADETLDGVTCAVCRDADGVVYDTWADAHATYANGGNAGCRGGPRCRGMVRPKLRV